MPKAIRQVSNIPFKFMYNIKEVPLSEIQQYLPDEHPDKIKEVKEEVKPNITWKIGDPLHKECKLKVFPALQEAQKFSDELLGESKTGLRVEDLVEGRFILEKLNQ